MKLTVLFYFDRKDLLGNVRNFVFQFELIPHDVCYCSSSNLDGDGDQGGKHEAKEERKPRRSSVFSKLGSYRQKKVFFVN